jgi:hypothetical protein
MVSDRLEGHILVFDELVVFVVMCMFNFRHQNKIVYVPKKVAVVSLGHFLVYKGAGTISGSVLRLASSKNKAFLLSQHLVNIT